MRQKILIGTAVLFGLLAFMITYQYINKEKNRIQGSAIEVKLVALASDLTEGQTIEAEHLVMVKQRRFVNAGSSREIPWNQKDIVVGRETSSMLKSGDLLLWTDLKPTSNTGKTGLTALVSPGFRAIAIPVDTTASVNCLVQPNNYVDLIGTFRFPDTKGDASLDTITLTVLERVRVIATGNDLGMTNTVPNSNMRGARAYSAVVLELTPKEVEMIIFASQKGRLHLSLRNYEELTFSNEFQSVDWGYLRKNVQKYNDARKKMYNRR